jgi:uncharacterized protein YqeY
MEDVMLSKRIDDDLISAQKNKEALKVSTLRLLKAAIHNTLIAKKEKLGEDDIIAVIKREAKQRKDSIEKFKQGNRHDLVKKEEAEFEILKAYLPAEIGSEELLAIVKESISETGASGLKDMGKVIKLVLTKAKGRADGKAVSVMVNRELAAPDKDSSNA